MRWPWQQKALTAEPAVLDATGDGWMPYPLLGGGSRQLIREAFNTAKTANYYWLYRNSPALRKVVDVIVRNVGQLDLRLYEEVDESERQPKPDHPAAVSLRYPSEVVSADKFVRSMFKDFLLADDAFALITPAMSGQITLSRMPFHMMEVVGSSLFVAEGYRLWRRDGSFVDFTPDQVLHWHGENPDDPRVGLSHLETLRDVIAEDVALREATVELAKAGLTEPLWAFRPLDAPLMSNQAEKGLEEELTNRVSQSTRKVVVTQEGTELRSFGVSPKDAQVLELRKWATQEIASEYGVPLGMVGLDSNVKDAQEEFYADCLPPYCEDFTKMLNHRVLVRVYNWTDGCFEFNLDEKHMGNDRIATLVSATGRAVLTTDEARAKLNLPPIKGGDELVTPLNVVVGEKPSPQVMPPQDPNKPPQDGSYRLGQGQTPIPSGKQLEGSEKALEAANGSQVDFTFTPHDPLVVMPRRQADLARQHRYVDEAQAELIRFYGRMERTLRQKSFDPARWTKELATDLHKLLLSIVEREGGVYAARLLAPDFDMRTVQNYLTAMAEGIADAINLQTKQDITDMGMEDALARARNERAPVAAASIGSRATSFARYEAAKQSPESGTRLKTWVADTERHAKYDGETVPLTEAFSGGFEPGSEANCRCAVSIT